MNQEEETGLFDKKKIFSVGQISSIISEVMSSELFMNILVRGEIISKQEKKGNIYLTLIDSDQTSSPKGKAILKVVIFAWYDKYIQEEYNIGDEVVVKGDMSYYAPFGSLSLNGKSLYLYGEGMELIRLKKLKEKLEKEGLFDQSRKKPLPKIIKKIAIITSSSGAAYHDIMETLSKKIPVSTVLYDSLVQGEDAPKSLIRALDRAYHSDCDLIIFGRGGGSKSDLSCFNDEALVRKVAASPICLITGIGHEIDTSLCDLAGDIYAITPTQAADKALPNLEDVLMEIDDLKNNLDKSLKLCLSQRMLELSSWSTLLDKYSPQEYLSSKQVAISSSYLALSQAFLNRVDHLISAVAYYGLELEKANPLNGAKEGLAIVKFNGLSLTSVKQVKPGDEVELGLTDGILNAQIK